MRRFALLPCVLLAALSSVAGKPVSAETFSNCSNDGQMAPRLLVERFMSADCADCWTDAPSLALPRGAIALDWVVPGAHGDEAAMSAVARRDAQDRLQALGLSVNALGHALHRSQRVGRHRLRVQHGPAVGDHAGASLAFHAQRGARGPFTGWLALVELLPAGTEGTPVPRALVRNLIAEPIAARPQGSLGQIWRPMNVPEGAAAERLEVIGWVSDARGRVLAAAQSACGAPSRK